MKIKSVTNFSILTVIALLIPAFAIDDHGHEHKKKSPGPNGGRVITSVQPKLEFFVTKERKAQITALTDDLKPAQLGSQIISITAGERSNPTKMKLVEQDGQLVTTAPLPEGNIPVSIGIKANAESKTIYEKLNLNLSICPGCKLAEYACICDH